MILGKMRKKELVKMKLCTIQMPMSFVSYMSTMYCDVSVTILLSNFFLLSFTRIG